MEKSKNSLFSPCFQGPEILLRSQGLLNDQGKPRLNVAQGYFRRAENQDDDELLESMYVYWRDLPEFMVLRSQMVNPRTYASEWSYVAVKCSKRGNDVYRQRVKRRLDWLASSENVEFFNVQDCTTEKKVFSSALWLTLTYDIKRCSRLEAIENIGKEWNGFLSALRQKYGKVSVLRTWECSEKGYPHIHAVLLFKEAKFSVFPHLSEDQDGKEKLTFRIKEKDAIASLWHSHVDAQANEKAVQLHEEISNKDVVSLGFSKGSQNDVSFMVVSQKRVLCQWRLQGPDLRLDTCYAQLKDGLLSESARRIARAPVGMGSCWCFLGF